MLNKVKIEGIEDLVRGLQESGKLISGQEIDKAVREVAEPFKNELKSAYIAEGHEKTGALVDSIQVFQRRRKGVNDPWFTYYVGPKYSGGNKLGGTTKTLSGGGNAAHLLEYGTAERFSADTKRGGATIGKRTYGAKARRGKVKPFGTIRRTFDRTEETSVSNLQKKMMEAIIGIFKQLGFKVKE